MAPSSCVDLKKRRLVELRPFGVVSVPVSAAVGSKAEESAPSADWDEPPIPEGRAPTDPTEAERYHRDLRDRRLVRRMRGGDPRAFEDLVKVYKDRIFGLTFRMMGDRQEAEDLAQEVFITVHRAIGSYRGDGRFYTWLYRIATNTCKNRIKYLKGRNFHRSVPVEESPEAHDVEGGAPGARLQAQIASPEAMTAGNRLEAAIQRELAALEPEHRLLIVLRDIQGLSYQEILRITGLQEGTLKSRLHRARLALKDRLQAHLT